MRSKIINAKSGGFVAVTETGRFVEIEIDDQVYSSTYEYLRAEDARNLGEALIKIADYIESKDK